MKDSERPDSPIAVWMRHTKAPFILIKIKPNQTQNNAATPLFSQSFGGVTSEKCSIIVTFVADGRCNLNSILTHGGFRATGTPCFDADRCDGYITAIRNATSFILCNLLVGPTGSLRLHRNRQVADDTPSLISGGHYYSVVYTHKGLYPDRLLPVKPLPTKDPVL